MIGNMATSRSFSGIGFGKGMVEHGNRGYSLVELLIAVAIIATLVAIAVPSYTEMVNSSRVVTAIGDIKHISFEIESYYYTAGKYPESLAAAMIETPLDPWDNPYEYMRISGAGTSKNKGNENVPGTRKDRNLHPLNSDYDLYSKGRDGKSVLPITAEPSKDDIIRANNGGFTGLAENY